jgi:hypothetical protein
VGLSNEITSIWFGRDSKMMNHSRQTIFVLIWLVTGLSTLSPAQETPSEQVFLPEPATPIANGYPTTVHHTPSCRYFPTTTGVFQSLDDPKVGYDGGFVIASQQHGDLLGDDLPYKLKINGWGQLRHTVFDSDGPNRDLNQIQLKRARLVFSGSAFTPDFNYFIQLDGRSVSGDDIRLLDYYLRYDFGHHRLGLERGRLGFLTGRYKVPFNLARWLSGREFEFTDRSVASIFFDVNRSLASSIYGLVDVVDHPIEWEVSIFNGLVTGGAETGSSGTLDNNFAISGRAYSYFLEDWGDGQLADFDYHERLALRFGCGFALSEIDRQGSTEFSALRVVDSGQTLASILTDEVESYQASLFSVDGSLKYRGLSLALEYYFRVIDEFTGTPISTLFDHGLWFQLGYFVVPDRLQLLSRWSRVQGNSQSLGAFDRSAEEIATGFAWYFRRNHAKLVCDLTVLDGAPINSSVLDISPDDIGILFRSQVQFSF